MSAEKNEQIDLSKIPTETLKKALAFAKKQKSKFTYIPVNGKLLSIPVNKVKEVLMSRAPSKSGTLIPIAVEQTKKKPTPKPKGETEVVVEAEQPKPQVIPVKSEAVEKIVEQPYTLKLFKKRVLQPHEEREEIFSRSRTRVESPSFSRNIAERVKAVFEPIFSSSRSEEVSRKLTYKPKTALKRKTIYKPQDTFKYYNDYDYEPSYTQIAVEDFAPKDEDELVYNPQVTEESYPVFTYATFGIPDTYVDQYAPEEVVRIKPTTEFTITARPKPLIVSQSYLLLLNKLINEVT